MPKTPDHIQNLRDAIDQIDDTPFGMLGKHFDRMADDAADACKERAALIKAIDGLFLVCGRTGNSLEDFEEQAEVFQKETGFMRPGKDMPMEGGADDNHEARRLKYAAWVQSKIEAGRRALAEAGAA